MTEKEHDPRLNAIRSDLADSRLRGVVAAERYVDGVPAYVSAPFAPFWPRPDESIGFAATKLMGEPLNVFETQGEWVWAQSARDGYVGYAKADAVSFGAPAVGADDRAFRVTALRAPVYLKPNATAAIIGAMPFEARLIASAEAESGFHRVRGLGRDGWAAARHIAQQDAPFPSDWVSVAERFLGAPYVWGGETADGLDCSGLIALARRGAGLPTLRDSDMQAATVGAPLASDAALKRGDLIFWRGHVGVMRDGETLLHANAYAMAVSSEPLAGALARIAASEYGEPTARRRTM
ncbi:MAG: C40 family peptidase [Neomegalonema sp.]|nr:C40 family peptidase [Neomegalonema sp.]